MRKNNKRNNAKKERAIMVASSVFVLSALTLTGIYMKFANQESQDDGYTIDFTALDNDVEDKLQEIAQNDQEGTGISNSFEDELNAIFENDMDYMPLEEAGSGQIEIPGLTDGGNEQLETPPQGETVLPRETIAPPAETQKPDSPKEPKQPEAGEKVSEQPEKKPDEDEQPEKVKPTEGTVVAKTLNFAEGEGLMRPVSGGILMPYSMDRSIYFSTMRDYRYNPALVLAAETGTNISACATGKVINIFSNEEIGHAVTMDLGNGYQLTYGQLQGINVTLNSYVDKGDLIGSVAAPTKNYCVEGSNLYLKMTKDGQPVDPEPLFK